MESEKLCSRMLLVLCIESLYRNNMPLPLPLIWKELGVLTALERHPLVTITISLPGLHDLAKTKQLAPSLIKLQRNREYF